MISIVVFSNYVSIQNESTIRVEGRVENIERFRNQKRLEFMFGRFKKFCIAHSTKVDEPIVYLLPENVLVVLSERRYAFDEHESIFVDQGVSNLLDSNEGSCTAIWKHFETDVLHCGS